MSTPFLPLPHSSTLSSTQFSSFLQFISSHKSLGHKKSSFQVQLHDDAVNLHVYDCKIMCRGPDDRIYLSRTIPDHERIRKHITRGCVLIHCETTPEPVYYLFQGYGKFLGYTEEDDDDLARAKDEGEAQDDLTTQSTTDADLFFHDKYTNAKHMIRIEKENGKAAHFAVIRVDKADAPPQYIFVAGSKNVHVAFRNRDDVKRTQENEMQNPRYRGDGPSLHTRIAELVLDVLDELPAEKREEFTSTLADTGLMMNFELMLKDEQHVVDYALEKHELRFLSFTPRTFENDEFCDKIGKCLPVVASMEWVKQFGFKTAHYEVVEYSPEALQQMIESIRKMPNSEGAVIYFTDADGRTLGLWKVKSEWYIILRAIRERVVNMYVDYNSRIAQRMRQLQKRLTLTNEEMWRWNVFADALHKYTKEQIQAGHIEENTQSIRDGFATLLTRFMKEYKEPVDIQEAHSKLEMIDAEPLSMAAKERKRKGRWNQNGGKNKKRQKREPQPQKKQQNQEQKQDEKKQGFQLHYL